MGYAQWWARMAGAEPRGDGGHVSRSASSATAGEEGLPANLGLFVLLQGGKRGNACHGAVTQGSSAVQPACGARLWHQDSSSALLIKALNERITPAQGVVRPADGVPDCRCCT